MVDLVQIEALDSRLLGSIAASMEEAARRSGEWLVCRPGCTQCCIGPFAITALDALRLQNGMRALEREDPERAQAVRQRADTYVAAIASLYPGNAETGDLGDEDALPEAFDTKPCPALNPADGACDLYAHRPVTCRTFGPVTRVEQEAFGACELCYQGASDAEMAACAVEIDPDGLEAQALLALERKGAGDMTIVAYALRTASAYR